VKKKNCVYSCINRSGYFDDAIGGKLFVNGSIKVFWQREHAKRWLNSMFDAVVDSIQGKIKQDCAKLEEQTKSDSIYFDPSKTTEAPTKPEISEEDLMKNDVYIEPSIISSYL
jgi:hypothetical protein